MQRRTLAVALALVACAIRPASTPGPTSASEIDATTLASIRRALNEQYASFLRDYPRQTPELPRVEVSRVTGESDLYVAICDWEERWWGTFHVLEFKDGRILWTAEAAKGEWFGANYVEEVRTRREWWSGVPVIEVLGSTHMGSQASGCYELKGRTLHLIPYEDSDSRLLDRLRSELRSLYRRVAGSP